MQYQFMVKDLKSGTKWPGVAHDRDGLSALYHTLVRYLRERFGSGYDTSEVKIYCQSDFGWVEVKSLSEVGF